MITEAQIGNLEDLFTTNILNGGTGSDLRLFTNNVLLSPQIELTDLDEATFDGYTPLTANSSWIRRSDPFTGRVVNINTDPFTQIVTGGTDLPQVIYGFYVVSSTGLLAAVNKFPTPVTLTANGNAFEPDVRILWNNSFQDNGSV